MRWGLRCKCRLGGPDTCSVSTFGSYEEAEKYVKDGIQVIPLSPMAPVAWRAEKDGEQELIQNYKRAQELQNQGWRVRTLYMATEDDTETETQISLWSELE